jgi:pimeloyl-ACP methyl ester carboxylesterase
MALPVLLVPVSTELEWTIAPTLAETTEVATYDAPGVGDEPPPESFDRRAVAERGIRELDDRGWDHCVVAGDEFAALTAATVASLCPDRVAGLALGHPSLSLRTTGPDPPLNDDVLDGFLTMEKTNYRAYAQALSQVTQGAYDEEFVTTYIERVPQEVVLAYRSMNEDDPAEHLDKLLAGFEGPLVFAEHNACLIWNREAFKEVTAAFPEARTLVCEEKPSVSPKFAQAVAELCLGERVNAR